MDKDTVIPVNLLRETPRFAEILLTKGFSDPRAFQMLDYYYGLGRQEVYTLQEIGDAEGITRERVRQINSRSVKRIRKELLTHNKVKGAFEHESLSKEACAVLSILQNLGPVLSEPEIRTIIVERYKEDKININHLRFLLTVFDFRQFARRTNGYYGSDILAWGVDSTVDMKDIWNALVAVYRELKNAVTPLSLFEIRIRVNSRRKKKIETTSIAHALHICPDIEKVSASSFQIKFPFLSSVADQAYRILFSRAEPLHYRDLYREINHFLASSGHPTDTTVRNLTMQMGKDERFNPIGRSGKWALSAWNHVHTQTTVSVMEEFFHLKKEPATIDEIHSYVISKRPDVPKNSIISYLYDKDIFIRSSPSKYALAVWGAKPHRKSSNQSVQERLIPEIQDIFKGEVGRIISFRELVLELVSRTGMLEGNLYSWLNQAAIIEVVESEGNSRQKLAKYTGVVKNATRKTLQEKVQEEIAKYLGKQPEQKAPIADVYEQLITKVDCKKSTFYLYLARMGNIEKSVIANIHYCHLVGGSEEEEPRLAFPQIMQITEEPLRSNISRAVELLNNNTVDIGLFELGKIFENELKIFIQQAQKKGTIQISTKDTSQLANMIDCVAREGIITRKHDLTFLRQERNERAHGKIPTYEERKDLMKYAPFLGGLYLDYIIFLYRERRKL